MSAEPAPKDSTLPKPRRRRTGDDSQRVTAALSASTVAPAQDRARPVPKTPTLTSTEVRELLRSTGYVFEARVQQTLERRGYYVEPSPYIVGKSGERATELDLIARKDSDDAGVSCAAVPPARVNGYDTNLAAEFYVLSCLHRIGLTANLTLGNKKGVDIIVARKAGDAVTIEVKGTAKKYDWVVNNLASLNPERHYVVLVSYEDRIADPAMPAPRVWVLPFPEVEPFRRTYKGDMKTLSRAAIIRDGKSYENAWQLLE